MTADVLSPAEAAISAADVLPPEAAVSAADDTAEEPVLAEAHS